MSNDPNHLFSSACLAGWTSSAPLRLHTPGPIPFVDDDEEDESGGGSGGGDIDPDDEEGWSDEDEENSDETLWFAYRSFVAATRRAVV